ncbi:MAG: hypothetical protein HDT42_05125 [Ruminococcaceae bacterium]|nr:hypothetical protein [Oscillospiraceae bacterium]
MEGLAMLALIVRLIFSIVIIVGIVGLSMFIPALVDYVNTRNKKSLKTMMIGGCLMIPIIFIGLIWVCDFLGI